MTNLTEALDELDGTEELRAQLAAARRDTHSARAHAAGLQSRLDRYEKTETWLAHDVKPPRWLTPKRKKLAGHRAIAATQLSDCHFDEVVDPGELAGVNAYNRAIAELRLDRYFDTVPWLAKHNLAGLTYEGILVIVGGDLISGDIHAELTETNEATTLETVLHWSGRIAAGLQHFADEFGAVHAPWVVGNHGRRQQKWRAKQRARDNFDWLIGQLVAKACQDDNRITFDIVDGTDALATVYDTKIAINHGVTNGGGGIGGIWPPIKRLRSRMLEKFQASGRTFDYLAIHHWHTLLAPADGLMVNGSIKGADEWTTNVMHFTPEQAAQQFFTVTPERGITWSAPVYLEDRKAEGW